MKHWISKFSKNMAKHDITDSPLRQCPPDMIQIRWGKRMRSHGSRDWSTHLTVRIWQLVISISSGSLSSWKTHLSAVPAGNRRDGNRMELDPGYAGDVSFSWTPGRLFEPRSVLCCISEHCHKDGQPSFGSRTTSNNDTLWWQQCLGLWQSLEPRDDNLGHVFRQWQQEELHLIPLLAAGCWRGLVNPAWPF
jgi:hypothetical protein